jgi:hypothetical protein
LRIPGFEPYMHDNWYSQSDLEPGHVKRLGFASLTTPAGYAQARMVLFTSVLAICTM